LTVKWGDAPADTCRIAYTLPARQKGHESDAYQQIESTCEASGAGGRF
jgi:outer membrane usher protein